MSVAAAVRTAAAGLAWYVKGLMGEDAYEKYQAHHESVHGTDAAVPAMTEREFWRDQTDRQDTNPQGRCC
ncbi:YbdD/YjiX family protein [Cryobacterium sp. W22_MBD10_FK3]|uniref:YbdD/YjiX family protein n=1 Tax=Cryobacterium sp. W22_MBD10_FK3 TaxID=3240273 RepID=UPI003F93E509